VKTSELIAKGKKYLWDGKDDYELDCDKSEYICYAILYAAKNQQKQYVLNMHQRCRDVIEARLFPWNNLNVWLQYGAGIPGTELTTERVQKHRLKWMNRLIKEYKAKGD
jgi:hypothetical protein